MSKYLINAPDDPQTFEEACDSLRALEEEVGSVQRAIRLRGKELILLRFRQGRIADRVMGMRDNHYGDSAMRVLAQMGGVHERTLYQALQFYRHPALSASEAQLRQWMEEVEEEKGRVSWSYCRNWAQKALGSDSAEEKLEKEAEKLERRATKLEQDAADLEKEVERLNGLPQAEEVAGVAAKAREVALDLREQTARLEVEDVRPVRVEMPDYLKHVRSYGCLVCGTANPDAHHLTTGGTGTKGPDVFTVPLCRQHHGEFHQLGGGAFERRHSVNLWKTCAHILAEFYTGLVLT